jgi:hypothetical protein
MFTTYVPSYTTKVCLYSANSGVKSNVTIYPQIYTVKVLEELVFDFAVNTNVTCSFTYNGFGRV